MTTEAVSTSIPPSSLMQRTSNGTLGKDDFLRLLMAQIANQDPMAPMDTEAMMQQMTSLGELEQLTNLNNSIGQSLSNDIVYQQSLQNQLAANLIGKRIRSESDELTVTGSGSHDLGYRFESAIESGKVEILDVSGNVVRTLTLGAKSKGDGEVTWDGKDEFGNAVAAGTYSMQVSGTDANGNAVTSTPSQWYRIDGVVYRGGIPYLTSNGVEIAFTDVREVREPSTFLGLVGG
ncbi:MAG: hypothetical protein OEM52_13325 [bacterium]|nr:hypothetical protein [bacterium]